MANIFISYNRKSETVAKTLADDIEALGHTAWYDTNLSGGQAWWDQILAKVRSCDIFVFVLDLEALNSTACSREYGYADVLGKPILPVLASEGVSINLLPPALSQIQFVDYRAQDRQAAFRLARALTSIRPSKPLPESLPAAPEVPISYLGNLSSKVDTISALTYEEQSGLVLDLKRSLLDPGTAADTETLLKRLRKRRDVFATIAEEIDELLVQIKSSPNSSFVTQPTKPIDEKSKREEIPLKSKTSKVHSIENNSKADISTIQSGTYQNPTTQERVKGALIIGGFGGSLEIVVNLIVYHNISPGSFLIFEIGGAAIAGFICGMSRIRIISAFIGIALELSLLYLLTHELFYLFISYPYIFLTVTGFLPSLGAVVGIFIEKQSRVHSHETEYFT